MKKLFCRTCCSPNQVFTANATCEAMTGGQTAKNFFFDHRVFDPVTRGLRDLREENFEKASSASRNSCPKGRREERRTANRSANRG